VTVSTDKTPARIAGMFDAIAWRYDRLNRLLSLGLDRRWRRRAVRELALSGQERVLDVCTGTADLVVEALTSPSGRAREVVGVDFAGEMLRLAAEKVARLNLGSRARFARGDATGLPLAGSTFDAAMVAFGIRNVLDVDAAIEEFRRVLRPGGRLVILEFGMPRIPGIRAAYRAYFRWVLPGIGRRMSQHGEAYSYLPASVEQFPEPEEFATLLRQHGFSEVRAVSLTLGIVYLYRATRGQE
jgi:demethylmenaquinone methyltransferase/2-methoxy-6-polyprenyl-1,4-benzoquinol methylase